MLQATEPSKSPKTVTGVVIIIKKKRKEKKNLKTVKPSQRSLRQFLEVSGRQWGAQLWQSTHQRKPTVCVTQTGRLLCAIGIWQ